MNMGNVKRGLKAGEKRRPHSLKSVLAILIAFTMVFTMVMPAWAFAEDGEPGSKTNAAGNGEVLMSEAAENADALKYRAYTNIIGAYAEMPAYTEDDIADMVKYLKKALRLANSGKIRNYYADDIKKNLEKIKSNMTEEQKKSRRKDLEIIDAGMAFLAGESYNSGNKQ